MQSTQKLVSLSIILLVALLAGSVLFLNSLEKNPWVQDKLVELFQNDPKVQLDMTRGEVTVSAEQFADEMILFAEDVLMYPFYMLVFALFCSLFGLVMMATFPSIAAVFLVLAGILSLFTLVPAMLLFFAANSLLKLEGSLKAMTTKNAI
ncbi:hypothetical protein ACRC6Q_07840 [Planococcus sp. SE5232]|uniref:hypothetical protein n=1 Tax=unclassified Planococcus (in: firmicutes) TaxID=2662419 RepID=UPI003D6BAED3